MDRCFSARRALGFFMPKTRELPIYQGTYVYARETYRIKMKLPKAMKYDLGEEIFSGAIQLLKNIVQANRAKDKTSYLMQALMEIEVQWALLRLLFDLRGISEGEFKLLSERLADIGKQVDAWQKWQKQKNKEGA